MRIAIETALAATCLVVALMAASAYANEPLSLETARAASSKHIAGLAMQGSNQPGASLPVAPPHFAAGSGLPWTFMRTKSEATLPYPRLVEAPATDSAFGMPAVLTAQSGGRTGQVPSRNQSDEPPADGQAAAGQGWPQDAGLFPSDGKQTWQPAEPSPVRTGGGTAPTVDGPQQAVAPIRQADLESDPDRLAMLLSSLAVLAVIVCRRKRVSGSELRP